MSLFRDDYPIADGISIFVSEQSEPAFWSAVSKFVRHFPYRSLVLQFPDVRHCAFIEVWHAIPSLSVRFCCSVSGLPSASARRLVKRLHAAGHVRGEVAFGCNISASPLTRCLR